MSDESYMRLALQMAEQALGQTDINPVVGCVIVKDGRIIGLGSHLQRGASHGEIHALEMAGSAAEGSTVYVTLEPCSHYGQTPPCSDRLVKEKVSRVVVACADPNPLVSGKGIERLKSGGIEVEVGLLGQEAKDLNEKYNKFIVKRLPFVTLKTASTLDGRIASKTGDSKWITGEQARAFVHMLRHQHQAIMVGADTVIADRPRLNTRLSVPALDPVRIIADSQLRVPEEALLAGSPGVRTIVLTSERASETRMNALTALGIETVVCGNGPRISLPLAMSKLGEMELGSILLEGGGRLNGAMLEAKLVDKMILFFAPKIIGGESSPSSFAFAGYNRMNEAVSIENVTCETFGNDLCIIGYPRYESGEA